MVKIISISLDIADPVTKPMVQIQPASGAVEYVGNMTLTCLVEEGTRLAYQWLKNGRPVHTSSNYFFPQSNILHIAPVTKEDIGNYSCLVKNPVSEMESDIIMPTIYCKLKKKIMTFLLGSSHKGSHRDYQYQMPFGFYSAAIITLSKHCLIMKYICLNNPIS